MFWISSRHFRHSLFLGRTNRTLPAPRDRRDSHVIVSLAPGPDVLPVKMEKGLEYTNRLSLIIKKNVFLCFYFFVQR